VSEDQELIPLEQQTEDGEQLPQPGLEEAEATSERALVPVLVSQIDFYGDGLTVVLVEIDGERQVLVPLRQFCQYLGVDWASQYQRTKRDEILAREMMSVVITTTLMPVRGQRQSYSALCLPLDLLPGWLFTLSPSRVKPEYRERVQRYRGLCYRALWRAFQRGELFPVEEPSSVEASASTIAESHDLRVVSLSEQIETLSAIVELMQEHKAALLAEGSAMAVVAANQQELMTSTDMISSQLDYVVTLLEQLVGRQETLAGRQETTETKVAKIDERTAHLTPQHARYVREMVDRIVQEIDRRSPGRPLTYAQVYTQVYGRLKRQFRVAKYDQVSDERFEEVKTWLQEEWRRVCGGTLPEQRSLF
jgi:P22_AR N-terminal domain/ORF6C domain